jgi:hypothetical protein
MNQRCTVCGKKCPQAIDSNGNECGPRWGRHVYGTITEPRCSHRCMQKPVVDVRTQRTIERMGAIVINASR